MVFLWFSQLMPSARRNTRSTRRHKVSSPTPTAMLRSTSGHRGNGGYPSWIFYGKSIYQWMMDRYSTSVLGSPSNTTWLWEYTAINPSNLVGVLSRMTIWSFCIDFTWGVYLGSIWIRRCTCGLLGLTRIHISFLCPWGISDLWQAGWESDVASLATEGLPRWELNPQHMGYESKHGSV